MSDVIPARGMRDVLPADYLLREQLIARIRETYESYGYAPMDTPVPERLEYLTAKAGGETEQLMFKILRRAQDPEAVGVSTDLADMGLRYDLTVSLCRFYATNQHLLPAIFRRYQIAQVWRADRPQRGRLREFFQCDVDLIGTNDLLAECEVILATTHTLRRLEIGDHFVKLSDRRLLPIVFAAMGLDDTRVRKAMVSIDKLDKIGVAGVRNEAAGYLDAMQLGSFSELVERVSTVTRGCDIDGSVLGSWGEQCGDALQPILDRLRRVRDVVIAASSTPIEITFSPSLVRGMAYYTGPIFEIWNSADPFSLAGGGRYDGLVGQFLGRDVPACGFSIGFERIFTILKDRAGGTKRRETRAHVLLALRAEGLEVAALTVASRLRAAGIPTELHPFVANIKRQFKHAEQVGTRWIIAMNRGEDDFELVDTLNRSRFRGELAAIQALIHATPSEPCGLGLS